MGDATAGRNVVGSGEQAGEGVDGWVPDYSVAGAKQNGGANRGYCSNSGKLLKHFSSITAKIRL